MAFLENGKYAFRTFNSSAKTAERLGLMSTKTVIKLHSGLINDLAEETFDALCDAYDRIGKLEDRLDKLELGKVKG